MPENRLLLVGLLLFATGVTWAANWLVWRRRAVAVPLRRSLGASVVWLTLMFVAGVIAARYMERLSRPVPGYGLFAVAAMLLSMIRARLYQRVLDQRDARPRP